MFSHSGDFWVEVMLIEQKNIMIDDNRLDYSRNYPASLAHRFSYLAYVEFHYSSV